jgi:hypothetical protein
MRLMLNRYFGNGDGVQAQDAINEASSTSAVREVKLAYLKGSILLGANPDNVARMIAGLMTGPVGILTVTLTDFGKTDNAIQNEADYKKLGGFIDDWATKNRATAAKGVRPNGLPYTWADWARQGRDYIGIINLSTKLGWDSSNFAAAVDQLKNPVPAKEIIKNVTDPVTEALPSLPTADSFEKFAKSMGWLVGALAGGVALVYLGPPIFRALRGLFDRRK